MGKIDLTQSSLLGVGEERKDEIGESVRRRCHGCGGPVYFSESLIPVAIEAARARGERLQFVCPKCAGPCLDEVAMGAEVVGTPYAMADIMPSVKERRRRFLQSN